MITEPDVTLTDYGLAVEGFLFAYLLYRRGDPGQPLRSWFVLFFGSLGIAALTGGTVHGFFHDAGTVGNAILWPATLIAIGGTTFAAWMVGATILFSGLFSGQLSGRFSGKMRYWARQISGAQFAGYSLTVLFTTQAFFIAIVNYLPAVLFLLVVFLLAYGRTRERTVLAGLFGLVLTFVAAVVQQRGVALHPVYFNHNALYHLIQAVALFLIFWSARWFVSARATR